MMETDKVSGYKNADPIMLVSCVQSEKEKYLLFFGENWYIGGVEM